MFGYGCCVGMRVVMGEAQRVVEADAGDAAHVVANFEGRDGDERGKSRAHPLEGIFESPLMWQT